MLTLAGVGSDDVAYDLGSGDGRIPIAAVQKFHAKSAVGIEIDPKHIAESKAYAAKAGVTGRVTFINQDMFTTPLGDATVVTLSSSRGRRSRRTRREGAQPTVGWFETWLAWRATPGESCFTTSA